MSSPPDSNPFDTTDATSLPNMSRRLSRKESIMSNGGELPRKWS